MNKKIWIILIAGLAVMAGTISLAVANDGKDPGSGNLIDDKAGMAVSAVLPAAGMATVKTVQWRKNGVNQGNIAFDSTGNGVINVADHDVVSFTVKGIYKGSGTGYLLFIDPFSDTVTGQNPYYAESWPLKPDVTITKNVVRSYLFTSSTYVRVEAHPPGSSYDDPGDWHTINVYVA